jgi:deoxyribose-phosphate aldolase
MQSRFPGEETFGNYSYSFSELKERARQIFDDTLNELSGSSELIRKLSGFIDLTTLEGNDTEEKVRRLCLKGMLGKKGLPDVAAICIYPSLLEHASDELKDSDINLASVAGGFPSGQTFTAVKCDEIAKAVDAGADEVDVVINRGMMLEGGYDEVFNEVSLMKEAAGNAHLKVILEISELPSVGLIRKASEICLLAGADFIKTSTGKSTHGATPEGFLVMADSISEFYEKTNQAAGIKAAGGIRTIREAFSYYAIVKEVLGEKWLSPEYFRIGASSLLDKVLESV